jgi:peroxiredoxin
VTCEGLCIGDEAPDFTLRDQFGQDVRLSDFRGRKAVVLMFFPFAFTGVCTGELSGVRDRLDEFLTFDTEVLAISCDSVYALRTFAESEGLNFPLLSDWWPHGAVSTAYEVFDTGRGAPARGGCAGRCTTPTPTGETSTSTSVSSTRPSRHTWSRQIRIVFPDSWNHPWAGV